MPDGRIGVLYIAPWVTIGGSDRNTIDWFRLLDRSRFRTLLVTTQESPNELFDEAARYADEAWDLPRLMVGEAMPQFIVELVTSRNVRVVHVMNSRLGFDLLPSFKRVFPHIRSVAQLHAEEHPEGTGYPRYVATRFDACVDAYSVISRHLANRLVDYGAGAERVHVVGLGVDTKAFDPAVAKPRPLPRDDGLQILFPARLAWQKDPLQVVEIARRLREGGSGAVVHVVGDGELRTEVAASIERHDLHDRVLLHGFDLDMPRWYAAADVTLLPSRYEGIPLTIYESMAMATPVVVANVGGIAELLTDEVGFLIDERDDPDAFVRALRTLEDDPGLRDRMGQAARQRAVTEFPVQRVADEHGRLYGDLVQTAPPASRPPTDLGEFDEWWPDDTAPLNLAVTLTPPRAWLTTGAHDADASVRVGRILRRELPGTVPVVAESRGLGHAYTAPLPGMVELTAVVPGHLEGLWRHAGGSGSPPPLSLSPEEALWVDAPYLLPEKSPTPSAPARRRRSPRTVLRGRRGS